ncbi:hypothetical protein EW145_g4 [Phellinidium pouzarii]|uniref:Alcohol dehydrogenase-like N-terminal domain-containing protein n=1 Tax=Phellinidium pouzarii TaxID=167371 RepID=A0A4S4LJT1_9AGAM|nr:hypothetical protein EW145_g4 [Phellinidium pouzarii]
MPKPTLLQRLFNTPSQSYSSPDAASHRPLDAHNFHSVKNDMRRAAAEIMAGASVSRSVRSVPSKPSRRASTRSPQALPASDSKTTSKVEDKSKNESNSNSDSSDEFFTPDTSPRESCCEDVSAAPHPSGSEEEDVTAPATTHDLHPPLSHSRSPSSASCSTLSVASTSTVANSLTHSETSWPSSRSASSSRATTPAQSDNTCSSSTRSSRRKRGQSMQISYTGDDWAKDVRWLVGPLVDSKAAIPLSSGPNPKRGQMHRPPEPNMPSSAPAPVQKRAHVAQRRSNSIGSQSTGHRSVGKRRMSAVWEEDEGDDQSGNVPPRRVHTDPAPLSSLGRSRTTSSPYGIPHRTHPSSLLSSGTAVSMPRDSVYTSPSLTVDLPVPLPVSDGGTPSGFTSLVLPRAAFTPSNKRYSLRFGSDSHIDITRSGLSQTTMSTISITKNAAAATHGGRTRSLSFSSFTVSAPGSETKIKLSSATPARLLTTLPSPLSFTSITPPPSKVHSNQVMVQVHAVGVDGLDDHIVSEKAARTDCYGFVPGRSFVGRAVECGFEVNSVSKSDWVIGLLDVRKCGALAEFIVVDKRRLARCPRPSSILTLEQLALLPLCGVPAHRAVRTSLDVQENGRALVLQGHDGAGALAVQELAASNMHVTVQVPSSISALADKHSKKYAESVRLAEEQVRRWGADSVCIDDAIAAVESFEDKSFDLVIDTIGGRRMWDVCRRILRTHGQFTTLVGESRQAVPSMHAHVRANMRSLRRAFVKDKKALGYALVSPAADVDLDGEDVRDSLLATVALATSNVYMPRVEAARCVQFESTPTLFTASERTPLKEGRTGVVRIVD